ncbi:hypothetical protein CLU79DRAFT_890600 [Phycomyces nitens]|nr:hypothetical protein CLU79DRAFT_890600 [Phycomyces nitens]
MTLLSPTNPQSIRVKDESPETLPNLDDPGMSSTNVEKETKKRKTSTDSEPSKKINTTKRPYKKALKIASIEESNQETIKTRPVTHKRTAKKVKDGLYIDKQNKQTESRNVQKKHITRSLTKVNGDSILLGPIKNPDRISVADFLVYANIQTKILNESLVSPENTTESNEQSNGTLAVDSNQSSSKDESFDAVPDAVDIKDEPKPYPSFSRADIQPTIQKVAGVKKRTQKETMPRKKQRKCLGIDASTQTDETLSKDRLFEARLPCCVVG